MVVCIKQSEKKIIRQRHGRFTMIFLTYGCLVVVVDCWPFTREISDNRKRKVLQIPDYYRKFSYDTHTTIVNIYNVSSYRIGIYEKFTDLRENVRCCNFYDNY